MVAHGCWKCADTPPRVDESHLLCDGCSLLNVGPGSVGLATFGAHSLDRSASNSALIPSSRTNDAFEDHAHISRESDNYKAAMDITLMGAHEPMDLIRYRGHTPPSDREFYPFDNFHVRGEEFGWNSDQAFVRADGSSVAGPARFLLKAAPLNAFEYQATLLTDQPSLFLDSLLQPEPIEGSLVSPTLQYVTRENFENSQTLHPGFQPKQPNENLGRSAFSMSGGQQSLYQAIMSLEYTSDGSSPHSSTTHESSPSSSTSTQPQPSTNVTVEPLDRDVDPEGIEITICGVLPLDPGVESNSLPFVLQSYAKWMRMMVFDPSRTVHKIKDHIIRRYFGSTQSRFRMILTANLLRAVIVFDTTYNPMLSILTNEIRQTLVQSKDPSLPVFWDSDISPLDYTLELNIFSLLRPLPEALQVLSDIAPVIRRMCSDPTAQYVHLPSLLAHGDSNVRGYPAIDIMYSMLTGLPTQLKYDATSRLLIDPGTAEPVGTWLIGQPRELTLILARIFSLHDEFGVDVDSRIIEEIESDLKDFRPDPGISVEPSLMVTRLAVLEAWRQVGYINLYMRLCGESALGPRVRVAHRRLMDLFATTKSGLAVNLHLAPCLGIAGLAATQTDERNLVLARLQSLPHSRGDTFLNSGIRMFQYIWVQTDSEGRPARWSDLRAATWRIVGI